MLTFLIALAIVAGIGAGVYFFVIKKKAATQRRRRYPPAGSSSIAITSAGRPRTLISLNRMASITASRHAPLLAIGRDCHPSFHTQRNRHSCSHAGNNSVCQSVYTASGDNMSGAGDYQQYRYYHVGVPLGAERDYPSPYRSMPTNGVMCWARSGADHQSQFLACLANAAYIGFVFGDPGAGATGHGVYANGPVHFHLNEFSVT